MRMFLTVAAVAGLLTGCGGDSKTIAVGKIVKGGVPFTVPPDDFVRVIFIPYAEIGTQQRNNYICDYDNAAGTFKTIGPDLKGIPPGKYRVTVAHERKKKDLFKGAYDLPKSPFVFDIDSSTTEIVIDLDKK